MLRWLDSLAHALHLPRWMRATVCDRYEARLLASAPDDFFVEDEPVEDVIAAFERADKHLTQAPESVRREIAYRHRDEVVEGSGVAIKPWRPNVPRPIGFGCQHMYMTAGNGTLSNVQGSCGCDMQPIYATA